MIEAFFAHLFEMGFEFRKQSRLSLFQSCQVYSLFFEKLFECHGQILTSKSNVLKWIPLSVCVQSVRSSSVAFISFGKNSSGKTCGLLPSSLSTNNRPLLKVTLTFFSWRREVN